MHYSSVHKEPSLGNLSHDTDQDRLRYFAHYFLGSLRLTLPGAKKGALQLLRVNVTR
jgi:hypothetical protein